MTRYLVTRGKKLVFEGSSKSGFEKPELAAANITGGLYVGLEDQLAGGVYLVSAREVKDEHDQEYIQTNVYEGLGSVKLHSDGIFYAPNSKPLLTIVGDTVYKTSQFDDMQARIEQVSLLPDLSKIYFENLAGFSRLEAAFQTTHIETVENDAELLKANYSLGKRIFVLRTRGTGNGSLDWREAIEKMMHEHSDVSIILITSADSGKVDTKKYAAGLNVPGVLSGLALREEAAKVLVTICNDLKMNASFTTEQQQEFIERNCYVGVIV
jgi:L-asparaginase/Glu-tRNA(Gln) amidotransferase subunit D